MKFWIDGENGKIAKKLKELIPKNWEESSLDYDLLFRTKKESTSNERIIDLTSLSKQENDSTFDYAFPLKTYRKNISVPGCSALLVLSVLKNINSFIEKISVEANFPLSAIKETSKNKEEVKNKGKIELEIDHFHMNEIQNFLKKEINYKTVLENRENCLLVKIIFNSYLNKNDLTELIQNGSILNKKINFKELENSSKIHFNINSIEGSYELICAFDNIHFVCDYAIKLAKKISP